MSKSLSQTKKSPTHAYWSSRFAFIMATTGAAVGLGNIWKFPYMAGENGGGLFVAAYLICVACIGIPLMMAEILIGRLGRSNPVNTLENLATQSGRSSTWKFLGWWGALGLVLVLSFYSVVAGWSVGYLLECWQGAFIALTPQQIETHWQHFLADPYSLIIWHTVFMTMTLFVISQGVHNGIERFTKILMPGLFLILIILMFYCANVGDIKAAFNFLLMPDLKELSANTVIYALGHAFFTLAIGAGAMLTYGSYIKQGTRIAENVIIIAILDVIVALLSGLTIFSLVFKFNLTPEGGPGLMFKILPIAFSKMPAGSLIGGLFFLLLWFAAWASSLSMAEPLVVILIERLKMTRMKASIIIGLLCWTLGLFALFSFNIWSKWLILGRFTIFEAMADFTTNIILPVGGALFAIFAGFVLKAEDSQQGLLIKNNTLFKLWHFLIRYLAPVAILFVLVSGLL